MSEHPSEEAGHATDMPAALPPGWGVDDAGRRRRRRRRILKIAGAVAVLLLVWFWVFIWLPAYRNPVKFFEARRSDRFEVRIDSTRSEAGLVLESLRIEGFRTGADEPDVGFDAYYSRPEQPEGPMMGVVLMGGIRTGREAMRIISTRPHIGQIGAFLTMDYPYNGPRSFRGLEMVPWIPRVREALFDGVEATRLAVDFLLSRPEIDQERIVLLGGSLGAFYVTDAAALDHRPAAVISFMGGGNITSLLESNLRSGGYVGTKLLSVPAAAFIGLLIRPLEPTRLAEHITPVPYVQVSATADERIPRENALAVYDAALEPRKLVWMEADHVLPNRDDLIERMIELALEELRQLGVLGPD